MKSKLSTILAIPFFDESLLPCAGMVFICTKVCLAKQKETSPTRWASFLAETPTSSHNIETNGFS